MARSFLQDYLQTHAFWLFDFSEVAGGLPVLDPTRGFSAITTPEITAETKTIIEGNNPFATEVVLRASAPRVTLQRGVLLGDFDFYHWMMATLWGRTRFQGRQVGGRSLRRDLLLIQFVARGPFTVAQGVASIEDPTTRSVVDTTATALAPGVTAAGRIPARAWVLEGCLPVRYKAGTDFDATSAAISVAELELALGGVVEYGLG